MIINGEKNEKDGMHNCTYEEALRNLTATEEFANSLAESLECKAQKRANAIAKLKKTVEKHHYRYKPTDSEKEDENPENEENRLTFFGEAYDRDASADEKAEALAMIIAKYLRNQEQISKCKSKDLYLQKYHQEVKVFCDWYESTKDKEPKTEESWLDFYDEAYERYAEIVKICPFIEKNLSEAYEFQTESAKSRLYELHTDADVSADDGMEFWFTRKALLKNSGKEDLNSVIKSEEKYWNNKVKYLKKAFNLF